MRALPRAALLALALLLGAGRAFAWQEGQTVPHSHGGPNSGGSALVPASIVVSTLTASSATITNLTVTGSFGGTAPSSQTFLVSGTYTTPANVRYLELHIQGGGGGGGGASVAGSLNGAAGLSSQFSVFVASGGAGGALQIQGANPAAAGGVGGAVSGCMINLPGGRGENGNFYNGVAESGAHGAMGGTAHFGAPGPGGGQAQAGSAGANFGGGGGGGGGVFASNLASAAGGGGGAHCYAQISSPAATYSVIVSTGGTAGTGTDAGGNGAPGLVQVIEHYGF